MLQMDKKETNVFKFYVDVTEINLYLSACGCRLVQMFFFVLIYFA